mmetsp:Transcript_1505/g.1890  ORF Transcript_1505/g.1890 Transcript_1505/m.1890 type:complete len:151 (-) Transcript_1505:124-576(-)
MSYIYILRFYVMVIRQGEIEIQGQILDDTKKAGGCGVISVFLLVLTGQFLKLLGIISFAFLLVGLHLVFKPKSVQSKYNRFANEVGGGSGRGGASSRFLNPHKSKQEDEMEDVEGGYDKHNEDEATSGVSSNLNMKSGVSTRQRPQSSVR